MAREVDRLLAQLTLSGAPVVEPEPPKSVEPARPRPNKPARTRRRRSATPRPGRHDHLWLWARVVLGVVLGVVMTQWPYRHPCGWSLAGYLGAVLAVMFAGAWIGLVSWRQRNGGAHLVGLILFFWGIVLAAEQVLPRIGYAAVQASWQCR